MGWHNIEQTLSIASACLTHQLVNKKIPELLSFKFDEDLPDINGKPKRKPANFGRTRVVKSNFRYNAYKNYHSLPDWLTSIQKPKLFKKWIKLLKNDPNITPKDLKHDFKVFKN